MTPTLIGRWQTRLLLFATAGALVTVVFGLIFRDFKTVFVVLGYVLLFGFGWDILYQWFVSFRWDQDWPTTFQVLAGIWEAVFIWLLARLIRLPGIDSGLILGRFIAHYTTVWLVIFMIAQGPIRLFFPRWRFRGGQVV